MIKKLGGGYYRVESESGKNLGTFRSMDDAKKHLSEVEYFKRTKPSKKESKSDGDKKKV